MFDERMFYTALSRAMYLDQIFLIYAPEIINTKRETDKKIEKK